MSFEIFFQPIRYGGKPAKMVHPFTGETVEMALNKPLTSKEVAAVKAVLKGMRAEANELGVYDIAFKDGGQAMVDTAEISSGCMVSIHGTTPLLLDFLMALLRAGNWGMRPVMEKSVIVVATMKSVMGKGEDNPEIVVCESAAELGKVLKGGVKAWKKFRDQVVDER